MKQMNGELATTIISGCLLAVIAAGCAVLVAGCMLAVLIIITAAAGVIVG